MDRVEDEGSGRRFRLNWPGLTDVLTIGESVAVNGCCLTVVSTEGTTFDVQAGPETLLRTNLGTKSVGDPVNLEVDLMAKYVEKMMRGDSTNSSLTVERLVEQGF